MIEEVGGMTDDHYKSPTSKGLFFFPMVPLLDTCTYPIQQGFNNSGEQTNFLKIKVLEE